MHHEGFVYDDSGVQMVATTLHLKIVFLALTLCVAMLWVAIPSIEILILGLFQKPTMTMLSKS